MWMTVKLGDVATVIAGQSPKGEHYNKEGRGTPFYQGKKDYGETYLNEPTVWTDVVTKLAEKDDILMSVRAPVGALNIATQKICIGRGLAAIRPSTEMLHDYLFYSLLLISHQLEGSAGAIFNSINKAQIEAIEIPLPPLAEQQRIVAKLDAAFVEIDRALGIMFKQESEVKKLFAAALSYQISAQDFPKANIQTLCEIGDGNHSSNYPKKAEMVASGVPFIRAGNIQNGTVIDDDLRFISEEKHAQLKKGHLREGDVLITNRGEIGKTAIVPKQFNGANLNSQIAWLRPHDNLLSEFLFFALNTTNAKNTFGLQQSGAALQQLTIKQLKAFEIPLPSLEQQQRIVECLRDVSTHTNKLSGNLFEKQKQLQTTKSALLAQELQPPRSEAA